MPEDPMGWDDGGGAEDVGGLNGVGLNVGVEGVEGVLMGLFGILEWGLIGGGLVGSEGMDIFYPLEINRIISMFLFYIYYIVNIISMSNEV